MPRQADVVHHIIDIGRDHGGGRQPPAALREIFVFDEGKDGLNVFAVDRVEAEAEFEAEF